MEKQSAVNEVLTELEEVNLTTMTMGQLVAYGNEVKRLRESAGDVEKTCKAEVARVNAATLKMFNDNLVSTMSVDGINTYLSHEVNVVIVNLDAVKEFARDHDEGMLALMKWNATSFASHVKKGYLAHPELKDQYFTDPSKLPEGLRGAVRISEATVVRRRKA